jgi:hypothetical protein
VRISGQPVAHLVASTSGTDSDWVVKLIDVYPDEVADQPDLGGYELMISADIFRGRYRESLAVPHPIPVEQAAGIQIQCCRRRTMFFCPGTGSWCRCSRAGFRCTTGTRRPNIFFAKPADYVKATADLPRGRRSQLYRSASSFGAVVGSQRIISGSPTVRELSHGSSNHPECGFLYVWGHRHTPCLGC